MKKLLFLFFISLALPACQKKDEDCRFYTKLRYTNLGQPYRNSSKNGVLDIKTKEGDSLYISCVGMDRSVYLILGLKKGICVDSTTKIYFVFKDNPKKEVQHYITKKECDIGINIGVSGIYEDSENIISSGLRKGKLDSIYIYNTGKVLVKARIGEERHNIIKKVLACIYENSESDGTKINSKKE